MLTIAERLPPRNRGVYAVGTEACHRGREALAAGWVTAAAGSPTATPVRLP